MTDNGNNMPSRMAENGNNRTATDAPTSVVSNDGQGVAHSLSTRPGMPTPSDPKDSSEPSATESSRATSTPAAGAEAPPATQPPANPPAAPIAPVANNEAATHGEEAAPRPPLVLDENAERRRTARRAADSLRIAQMRIQLYIGQCLLDGRMPVVSEAMQLLYDADDALGMWLPVAAYPSRRTRAYFEETLDRFILCCRGLTQDVPGRYVVE